jgi:GH25 family lysozyme M1 (1,4-beta-N-acetylmuramidase)
MTLNDQLFGCDVSRYQSTTLVPWDDERIDFGIVKCTDGLGIDSNCIKHVEAIRKSNKTVGLYCFFHPEIEIKKQFENFWRQTSSVIAVGDITPAIDIESFGTTHGVTPLWSAPIQALAETFTTYYGKPLLYMGINTWELMGKPTWVANYPLWVPRYVYDGVMPPPPPINNIYCPCKKPASIWQGRVSPLWNAFQYKNIAGAVDQNWAVELPRVEKINW